ncbi:MAG: bacterial Ig-like domain-containing protein, partial [Bacilli bacterium]|nr:bacterial Ig-like domain-containing protein [Bacilli bacterium]
MKLFNKIAIAAIGAFMAIGGGVAALGNNGRAVTADGAAKKYSEITSGNKYYISCLGSDSEEYVLKTGAFSAGGSDDYSEQLVFANLSESDAWTFNSTGENEYTISCMISGETYYLGVTNANNGVKSSTDLCTWTVSQGSSESFTKLTCSSRDLAGYEADGSFSNWRSYSSNNGIKDITLYEYRTSSKTVTSLEITSNPTKTTYNEGEALDLSGLVVTATWSDSSQSDVTNLCTYNPADGALLVADYTSVTISYGGKTTSFAITVNAVIVPASEMYFTASLLGIGGSYASSDLSYNEITFGRTDICAVVGNEFAIQFKASSGALWNTKAFPAKITKLIVAFDANNSNGPSNFAVYAGTAAKPTSNPITANIVDSTNRIYEYDFSGGVYKYFNIKKTGTYAMYIDMFAVQMYNADDSDMTAVTNAANTMLTSFASFCSAGQGPSAAQWNSIKAAYTGLTAAQKTIFDSAILNTAACNSSDAYGAPVQLTEVQKAVQKIEYCVSTYGVENFTSRTIESNRIKPISSSDDVMAVVIISSITVISLVGAFFLL